MVCHNHFLSQPSFSPSTPVRSLQLAPAPTYLVLRLEVGREELHVGEHAVLLPEGGDELGQQVIGAGQLYLQESREGLQVGGVYPTLVQLTLGGGTCVRAGEREGICSRQACWKWNTA